MPAGSQYDSVVAHIDVFSTALVAAGVSLPDDRVFQTTSETQVVV